MKPPLPREVLAAILADYVAPETVATILQRLGAQLVRDQRAEDLERYRGLVARYGDADAAELAPTTRRQLVKARIVVAHGEEYLEGTWKP